MGKTGIKLSQTHQGLNRRIKVGDHRAILNIWNAKLQHWTYSSCRFYRDAITWCIEMSTCFFNANGVIRSQRKFFGREWEWSEYHCAILPVEWKQLHLKRICRKCVTAHFYTVSPLHLHWFHMSWNTEQAEAMTFVQCRILERRCEARNQIYLYLCLIKENIGP